MLRPLYYNVNTKCFCSDLKGKTLPFQETPFVQLPDEVGYLPLQVMVIPTRCPRRFPLPSLTRTGCPPAFKYLKFAVLFRLLVSHLPVPLVILHELASDGADQAFSQPQLCLHDVNEIVYPLVLRSPVVMPSRQLPLMHRPPESVCVASKITTHLFLYLAASKVLRN